jgi:putative alpha-1,2-mannosidase
MGAKGEALAKQFETRAEDARAVLEKLTDADWKKTTAAEKWTVAATAHHLASSYERVPQIITTIATGQAMPHFTPEILDQMNAKHAEEFAGCTKAETLALHRKGGCSRGRGRAQSQRRAAREERHRVRGPAPDDR